MTAKQKALLVVHLAKDKKAEDIVLLDMRKVSNITDFFAIGTASSIIRAQAITSAIKTGLWEKKESIFNIEGEKEGLWIVVDANEVVVHIFTKEMREFYNLERLWADAPKVNLCQKRKYSRKIPKRE